MPIWFLFYVFKNKVSCGTVGLKLYIPEDDRELLIPLLIVFLNHFLSCLETGFLNEPRAR